MLECTTFQNSGHQQDDITFFGGEPFICIFTVHWASWNLSTQFWCEALEYSNCSLLSPAYWSVKQYNLNCMVQTQVSNLFVDTLIHPRKRVWHVGSPQMSWSVKDIWCVYMYRERERERERERCLGPKRKKNKRPKTWCPRKPKILMAQLIVFPVPAIFTPCPSMAPARAVARSAELAPLRHGRAPGDSLQGRKNPFGNRMHFYE